jgi:ABC-type transport system involved in multi-copper enzyme maturation permease subunit
VKLREVLRYELEHRVGSGSTWAYAVILFLVAVWMYLATADGASSAALANAPERLAGAAVLPGMFGMLVTAALFSDAAIRDVAAGMDPLVFTSPLRKAEYLGGRFLAALTVNAVILIAIPIGALVATALVGSSDPEAVGPFRASAYLQSYFLLLLPNLVVVGAVLFTIAALTRQAIPVYLGAIGIFVAYVVALNYGSRLDTPLLAALIDPLGLVSLQQVTRYWTEAERNTRLIGSALLLWNRAVWLTVAAAVLTLLARRFRFAHADGGGGRRRRREASEQVPREHAAPLAIPREAGSFGARTRVRQTLAVARQALRDLAAGRWFAAALLACAGLTVLMGWNVGETVFDTATWPVTLLVAESVQSERIVPIVFLLIVVFAGELVWKERETGAAEMADAAPVPDGVVLIGRFVALVVIIVMIQLAVMVGGITIQALQGYYRFEIGLYAGILFGLNLARYLVLAALALTVHVAVNQKYLGHIVVLLVVASTVALQQFGIQHHLLLYNTDPGWTYSDMNGFGPFLRPFVWFKLYWGAWALLLGVIAVLFQLRGREPGLRSRLRQARSRFGGSVAGSAGVAAALIFALGGFVFYNTNVINDYETVLERGAPQAAYERRYGRFRALPQPTVTAAKLDVELSPDAGAAELRGTYRLVNRTAAAIDSVHLYLDPAIVARSVSLAGAEPAVVDAEAGYRIYALARALAPGDSLDLAFDLAFRPRGFPNDDIGTSVVANGSFLDRRWLPFIGYQPLFELENEDARKRFGLAPRAAAARPAGAGARRRRQPFTDADLVHIETTVGTAADQIAIASGTLRRTWTDRGRRYFHYETEAPTSFGSTIFSARYAVLDDRWTDAAGGAEPVALRIFHHPAHDFNLDRMVAGMKASLDYFTAQFGPYPYRQLRIVENPRYGGFGHAHPETIGFTEDVFFARVKEGEFDQTFYGTAHEVAHTWWGGQVRGADGVRGQALLSEALANYSAMMVTEKTYGLEAAQRVYDYQMNRYLTMRGRRSGDVPLLEVEDQAYISYGKGAVAMYLLRDHLGEDRVNAALRRYLDRFSDSGPPYPTSLDLYAELRAATPDSLRYLLTDLFETVTVWDVSADRAEAEPTGTGEYQVTLRVAAKKLRADSVGNEREVPMNDLVEIGVFAAGEGGGIGKPLHLQRHRIRSGVQTIVVRVSEQPARAGIDPNRKLIDREREDNVVDVE